MNLIKQLDHPTKSIFKFYAYLIFILIYTSVLSVTIEANYSEFYQNYKSIFIYIDHFILFVFTIELIVRFIFDENRWRYFRSFYGLIDLLSVLPGLVSFLFTGIDNTVWARIFKIFRILRILKIIRAFDFLDGITGKLVPFFAFTIALKGVMVMFESYEWWPTIPNINTFIAVIGFALAVLMGTKLSVVNGRIYQIEDAVCRIVGSLRDMRYNKNIDVSKLYEWSEKLEKTLTHQGSDKPNKVQEMRNATNEFEVHLEEKGIGGPNTANFHRDVAYLLHRVVAKTPPVYEKFLKHIIVTYITIIIFILPGISGLLMSTLIVYVLGGMYYLIDDMDNPLDYNENSFIDVRLDALESYNKELKKSKEL